MVDSTRKISKIGTAISEPEIRSYFHVEETTFTQLMAEMIALEQRERAPNVEQQPMMIGAVTTGAVWQFARLDRQSKQSVQGVNA